MPTYYNISTTNIANSDADAWIPSGRSPGLTLTQYFKNNAVANVRDFGAVGDGVTSDTAAFRLAIKASLNVFIPAGAYLIDKIDASEALLYLGTQGSFANPVSRNGLTVFGEGFSSVIKLGSQQANLVKLFSGGVGDNLAEMTFRDFAVDLNAANNLQPTYGSPHRDNQAFYFYCKCTRMMFRNLYVRNGSGSQLLRIGGDSAETYADDVTIQNCRFSGFGIGIPGNFQQDCSAAYVQGTKLKITNNIFECPETFAFDLSRGHTAVELHCDRATLVHDNIFRNVQLPVLLASSSKPFEGVIVSNNRFDQCSYLCSLDASTHDQTDVLITGNAFTSTLAKGSSVINIGGPSEPTKVRDQIVIQHNILDLTGNTNREVSVILTDARSIRTLTILNNTVLKFSGPLVLAPGPVVDSGNFALTVADNILDSLGSTRNVANTYDMAPCFVQVQVTSGSMASLTVTGNTLRNSMGKNYAAGGLFIVSGDIQYTAISNNRKNLDCSYPFYTSTPGTSVTRQMSQAAENAAAPNVCSADGFLTGNSTKDLLEFTSFSANDFAMMTVMVFAGVGGTVNQSTCIVHAALSVAGGSAVATCLAGTYAGNLSFAWSGNKLRVTSTTPTTLAIVCAVQGYFTKPVKMSF